MTEDPLTLPWTDERADIRGQINATVERMKNAPAIPMPEPAFRLDPWVKEIAFHKAADLLLKAQFPGLFPADESS